MIPEFKFSCHARLLTTSDTDIISRSSEKDKRQNAESDFPVKRSISPPLLSRNLDQLGLTA